MLGSGLNSKRVAMGTIRKNVARVVFLSVLVSGPAAAHTAQQPPHQLYSEGDLMLESGEAIKDFSISFVTPGRLNTEKSNAILMVTAISGNHHRIDFMIGPGKALDPDQHFIICTDAIGNGLTPSPSNSKAQPRMQFPKFAIRDMVESQYRLVKEKFGIEHLVAVIGPSMGGMQTLQWGISHPDYMDALVAMVPLAKTPGWTVAVLEASRKAIMNDPAWTDGRHDLGTSSGFNGDTAKALASIKAKTLILTGTKDLLNPEFEPTEAGRKIPNVKMLTISPGTVTGHASAGGFFPADVDFLNREVGTFLDSVTEGGKKLN